jgi:hypothetical protein
MSFLAEILKSALLRHYGDVLRHALEVVSTAKIGSLAGLVKVGFVS